ncbi:unnamed protein product [Clonostachys rhizophaga]|uniref:Uncharacterized protein n=1 Tax=Clonostachys rhizophaga TaxID=160324 RepID=A0A9N9VKH9_9HYPO|nr:unnamed protein product [Clonostachys rhizophaga]
MDHSNDQTHDNPFSGATTNPFDGTAVGSPPLANESPIAAGMKKDRRMSDEWDAAKTVPSQFQKRKGSIYATPSSRDGHIDRNRQDKYYEKIAEKYSHVKNALDNRDNRR